MDIETAKNFVARARAVQSQVDEMLVPVYGKRTTEEIEDLKAQWLADPSWDIEQTEGFEAHEAALTDFHEQHRRIWDIAAFKHTESECNRLGCSPQMLSRLKFLESRIDSLSRELAKLRGYD